ncbi:hypothetical protein AVEN_89184-1 [Araneus ventricosus]|uniref:Uncharacterized protein n=1 Tax=Araneus ventricosus TaxID=182803 RepID=A0A4Y2B528_ARAVE|nr:hypothetical protein AVEN_89184-1 [Araneus ventricosus]
MSGPLWIGRQADNPSCLNKRRLVSRHSQIKFELTRSRSSDRTMHVGHASLGPLCHTRQWEDTPRLRNEACAPPQQALFVTVFIMPLRSQC